METWNVILFIFPVIGGLGVAQVYPEHDVHEALQLFTNWKKVNMKTYKLDDINKRYEIFLTNLKIINQMNRMSAKFKDEQLPPKFGLTPFADLTSEEFKQIYLNQLIKTNKTKITRKSGRLRLRRSQTNLTTPDFFDWSLRPGVVTSVKSQGDAGACWAFAGCAHIEGLLAINTGRSSPDLSPQAVLDCNGVLNIKKEALACGTIGGNINAFFEFLLNNGQLMLESDYPYCTDDNTCSPCAPPGYSVRYCGPWYNNPCRAEDSCQAKFNMSKALSSIKVTSYRTLGTDERQLTTILRQTGPLVASLHAKDLQFYKGGVLRPINCNPNVLDHMLILTGYNVSSNGGVSYWIVKNSWGTQWGEAGFGKIVFGVGACGINTLCATAKLG